MTNFETFAQRYGDGRAQLLHTRLVADLETPVSAYLKLGQNEDGSARENSFLLESVQGGEARGRYSIVGLKPDLIWRCHGDKAEINRNALNGGTYTAETAKPLESLRTLVREMRVELPPGIPPMAAGLFGYLGYDMARQVEHLPNPPPDTLGLPDAIMLRPTIIAIFDTVKETGDHGSFNSWGRDRFWRPDNAEVEAWVREAHAHARQLLGERRQGGCEGRPCQGAGAPGRDRGRAGAPCACRTARAGRPAHQRGA